MFNDGQLICWALLIDCEVVIQPCVLCQCLLDASVCSPCCSATFTFKSRADYLPRVGGQFVPGLPPG